MHTVMSFDSPSLTAMEGDAVREVMQDEGKECYLHCIRWFDENAVLILGNISINQSSC